MKNRPATVVLQPRREAETADARLRDYEQALIKGLGVNLDEVANGTATTTRSAGRDDDCDA